MSAGEEEGEKIMNGGQTQKPRDPANNAEDHTHRVGRTGRAGDRGNASPLLANLLRPFFREVRLSRPSLMISQADISQIVELKI